VDGFALGGGFELALMADVMVLGPTARLGLPETNLGLIPGAGGGQRLMALAGRARAMRMVLTGEIIDAATAFDWGIAAWLSEGPAADLAEPLAAKLAARAPLALMAAKRALIAGEDGALASGRRARGVRGTPRHGRQVRRHPRLPRAPQAGVQGRMTIGIVGLGAMGLGIAQVFAQAGHEVRATDAVEGRTHFGPRPDGRRAGPRVAKGAMTEAERDATLARLTVVDRARGYRPCRPGDRGGGRTAGREAGGLSALEPLLAKDAVLATNTSSCRSRRLPRG
jgi:hypothetical protein